MLIHGQNNVIVDLTELKTYGHGMGLILMVVHIFILKIIWLKISEMLQYPVVQDISLA
jgi:hypothetical protein